MSPDGDDDDDGSQEHPVRTLNRATQLVSTNGTIVVRGGQYRDWLSNSDGTAYKIASRGFTLQAYPHEKAWFNGADIVTSWNNAGSGRWSRSWSTPSFCAGEYYDHAPVKSAQGSSGPCAHADNIADPAHPMAGDPQMVFIDDVAQLQVSSLDDLGGGKFHYDWSTKVLTLGSDPSGRRVEVTARPVAMILGNQQRYAIRGLGFTKYATNEYNNLNSGAVYLGASKAVVEDSVFARNAGQALFISNPKNSSRVSNSVFAHNGFNGLGANGGSKSGTYNGFLLEDSVFNANNAEHFGKGCTASCSAANVKYGHMKGLTVRGNIFENAESEANGFWCDLDCSDATIIDNVSRNNGGHGYYYEVSDTGIIASNLALDNEGVGIAVASANTKIYNNTVVTDADEDRSAQGIWIYDDSRSPGVGGWNDVGPDTHNVELMYNVLWGSRGVLIKAVNGTSTSAPNTKATQYFSEFDHNAVFHASGNVYNWYDPSTSSGGSYHASSSSFFSTTGFDGNARDVSTSADPFADSANGDYRLATAAASRPAQGSASLPTDVADVLGVPATAPAAHGILR